MKKYIVFALFLYAICLNKTYGQNNAIQISSILDSELNELKITQTITFFNKSDSDLKEIYLHNWPNAYKDKNTPLAKRFIENYSKSFHFAKEKHRGSGIIKSISVDYEIANWEINNEQPDIFTLYKAPNPVLIP